ncbi:hypothetical protein RND81_11G215600 [Saponaria officinalis]|uniref:Uncharacterized protein n=1 Tax=Saponaria officinalis TaxID=3572 RepID=A0AAW1HRE2_SAPOF
MAWRSGSLSRTLFTAAARSPATRTSAVNSTALRRPPSQILANSGTSTRRFSFTNPRFVEVLACAPSLMPVHSVVARAQLTSYVAVDARACCELSQGT